MRITASVMVLLAGCATLGADLKEIGDSWLGAQYDEVVSRWGTPARSTMLADGRQAYTWVSEGTVSRGTWYPSIGVFGGSGGVGVGTSVMVGPGVSETARCDRTLFFKGGRVVDQTWQGSAEYCSTFRRN